MKRKMKNLKRRWRKLAWYNQTSILLLIAAAILQMLILNIGEAILVLCVLYLYCDRIAECRKVAYTYYNTARYRYKIYYIDKHIELLEEHRKTYRRGSGKDPQLFRVRNQVQQTKI